jgi:alpha-glucosidase (family GH31 glycosyl hydrolase)
MGPEMSFVGEKKFDPLRFAIYPDESGSAATTIYEDDGLSPAYKQGAFRRTTITARRQGTGYVVTVKAPAGSFNPGPRQMIFEIKSDGARQEPVTITDNGTQRTVEIK